jgi:Family of unknown function (DUF6452)
LILFSNDLKYQAKLAYNFVKQWQLGLKINTFGNSVGSGLFCDNYISVKRWHRWVLIFSLSLILSCGDIPTCVDTETSLVKIKFLDDTGAPLNITLLSLKATNNEMGFPEYADSTLNLLTLPLNPGATTTTFILEQKTGIDTIGLSYTVVAKLISPECGLDASFDNMDTTFTSFNNLIILERIIHEDVTTNIEITL